MLHVDMDAFYASCELISRPELVGTPVIIGGGSRSVVLSATYEARAYGVHSAMPMTRARPAVPAGHRGRAEPRALLTVSAGRDGDLPVDHRRWSSRLSLDEAFLDVSGAVRRLGRPREIGQLIRDRVADEQGITCSVGIASTKFVAKLASTRSKPDGLLVVPAAGVVAFLHPLPVGALWGVG
jgi:DNA polymerase-4